jgi:hypothetical protein
MKDYPAAILAYLRQCTAPTTEGAICKAVGLKLFHARPYIDTLAAAGLAVIHTPSYRDTSGHRVTYSAVRPQVAGVMTGLHGVSLRHTPSRHLEAAGVAPQTSAAVRALTKAERAKAEALAKHYEHREEWRSENYGPSNRAYLLPALHGRPK